MNMTDQGRQAAAASRREVITPFDWERYNAVHAAAAPAPSRRAAGKPPLSARARAERILAQRWGNPYCRPGPVRRADPQD